MAKKEAPAGVAPGTGAGRRSGELLLCNTGPAENLASNVVAFPRRVPRCEHCGWLVPPGSATEAAHRERCTLPRQKAARIAAYHRQRWQEAQAKAAATAERMTRRRAALPPPRPSAWHAERLARLRLVIDDQVIAERLTDVTRLPEAALRRVAEGRSTLAPTAWRRLLPVLGLAAE